MSKNFLTTINVPNRYINGDTTTNFSLKKAYNNNFP